STRWPRRSQASQPSVMPLGADNAASCRWMPSMSGKKTGAGKQPYAIVSTDGLPLAMAGLWERWKDRASGDIVQSFTIITTAPNEVCGAVHDRMPAILPRDKWGAWLWEHEIDADELRWMVLRPYPAGLMRAFPVDARVGNVRNNDERLLTEINLA